MLTTSAPDMQAVGLQAVVNEHHNYFALNLVVNGTRTTTKSVVEFPNLAELEDFCRKHNIDTIGTEAQREAAGV
ncbi:hypothetical protein HMF8227_01438 [Saliniradius amylolyticus]|uniref:Uncharacterized protein n=2 Tax=Saliniradius amylolyticus TaxID=2183582 RepID=A0A2S2E2Q1_9ALTE|nr:hypothetical protein HMF8227_01438 [Saliniradius amylolyticus]